MMGSRSAGFRQGVRVLVISLGIQVLAVPSLSAQEDLAEPVIALEPVPSEQVTGPQPLPDGDYEGSHGFSGHFRFASDGGVLLWFGEGAGPISFSVEGSQLAGDWSMTGNSTALVSGGPVAGEAVTFWETVGAMTATGSGPYVMSSEPGSGETTANVTLPTGEARTQTSSYDIPAATGQLDRLLEVCGQISGSWDQGLAAGLSQFPGASGTVRTYLTAMPVGVSNLQSRINELVEDATALSADLDDPDIAVGKMYLLVQQAEDLLEEIGPLDLTCDLDGQFMRIVTLQIQDVIHTYLVNWSDLENTSLDRIHLLREMITVAMQAGAMGSGSADPQAAALLADLAAGIAQETYIQLVSGETAGLAVDVADQLAAIGLLLGINYTTPNGDTVTPGEICLALGGCS